MRSVFEGDGILKNIRAGQIVVDLGTSSVEQTRDFARQLQAKGASWADAPIARTRQAAQDGTLSVMVGAAPELFAAIEPLIRCFATDVTRCGDIGAGQVTKILNNMVLFETVNALAEAVAVARRSGVDPALLLDTLSKGSADSFALRNHGIKAIVPGNFPERAFSTEYALKDLSYALELAGGRRHQDSRRGTDRHDFAGSDRCRRWRRVFPGDREAHKIIRHSGRATRQLRERSPESITTIGGYGFRACAQEAHPGMTIGFCLARKNLMFGRLTIFPFRVYKPRHPIPS